MSTAVSMDDQFEASGVEYQGLTRWNRTEPTIRTAITIAIAILSFARLKNCRCERRRAALSGHALWTLRNARPKVATTNNVSQVAHNAP
jgi:hypothetical protein